MRGSSWMALFSGLAWLTSSRAALGAELSWQSVAGCPDREELVFRVERALGGPLVHAAALHFDVRVEFKRSSVDARIHVRDDAAHDSKERVVSAPDCDKLVDAVALTVALALGQAEPVGSAHGTRAVISTPAVSRASKVDPASSASSDAPVADGAAEAESEEHLAGPAPGVSVWLLGDAGSLPSPGLGAAFGLELSWQQVQLRGAATLLFEQHAEAGVRGGPAPGDDPGVAGADLGLALGSIAACAAPYGSFRSAPSMALCAGWEVGRLSGTGTGVPQARSGGALWMAPRIELGGLWPLPGTQLGLGGFLSAAAPLGRSEFVLRDIGSVHRASTVVGRVALGAVWVLE